MHLSDIFSQSNTSGVALDNPRPNEEVRAVVHSHWFVLLRNVFAVLLLFILPFIILPILATVVTSIGVPAAKIGALAGLVGSLWALICWQLIFVRWTDYYFDVWIITNWRVIDFELRGMFNVNVATILDLSHIQDVETHTVGVIQNILRFGNVTIQTAGQKREFLFEEAAHPRFVERTIRAAQAENLEINPIPHPI